MSYALLLSFAIAALALASCESVPDTAGVKMSGLQSEVTPEDIRAAIAADIRAHPDRDFPREPRQIDIIGSAEIHLYWFDTKRPYGSSHDVVKRHPRGWQCVGMVIVTS